MTNSQLSGNQGQYGGVFYLENDSQMTLTSIQVDTSQSTINGGLFYAIETNPAAASATISMQNPALINNM